MVPPHEEPPAMAVVPMHTEQAGYLKDVKLFKEPELPFHYNLRFIQEKKKPRKITYTILSLHHFRKQSVSLSEYTYFISCASAEEIHTKPNLQPKSSYADASEPNRQQNLASGSLPSLLLLPLFHPASNAASSPHFLTPKALASLLGHQVPSYPRLHRTRPRM